MFSSFLKKISDVIDGPSGGVGSSEGVGGSGGGGGTSQARNGCVGVTKLSEANADWAQVYSHDAALPDVMRRYIRHQREVSEGASRSNGRDPSGRRGVDGEERFGDFDGRLSMRADVSAGSPLPNAKLVAYDTTRQLVAVLSDSPSLTVASGGDSASPAAFALSTTAPCLSATFAGGSCVYIIGMGSGAVGGASGSILSRTIPVRDNEDWQEMVFIEGYHVLVLRSERVLCFIDTRSSTSGEADVHEENSMDPLYHDTSRDGSSGAVPFSSGVSLSPPQSNGSDGPLSFTSLCRAMPIGVGSVAVGTSNGRILFAPLFPPSQGTPMVWRKTSVDVKGMLEGAARGIVALSMAREATRRHLELRYLNARRGQEGRGGGSTSMAHLVDAVQCVVGYPSDPNTYLSSTRNSHGLVKWYLSENRLSAMFLLPHCYEGGGVARGIKGASPVSNAAALGEGFARTFVTAAIVTNGGGYVLGLTNTFDLVLWHEKEDKRSSDKSVPPFSVMCLLLSHPLASRLSSLPDNQSGSDEDECDQEEGDAPLTPRRAARGAHRVLLSMPDQMLLFNTVSPSTYTSTTECASSMMAGGRMPADVTGATPASSAAKGETSQPESQFLTVFIPTQQVQYSGSDATSGIPTEHCTVMTEVRLEVSTMRFLTVRHVPIQGYSATLTYDTHTKTRGWPYCMFAQYPVRISLCCAVPNTPWASERVCGLLLNATSGGSHHIDPGSAMSVGNARLSVKMSGGAGDGSPLRGSVRGSVVLASTVSSLASTAASEAQQAAHSVDLPLPLSIDGSPMSLVSFWLCATQTKAIHSTLRHLPTAHGEASTTVTLSLRTAIGEGVACIHRVVERFQVMEEEVSACQEASGTYINASYRCCPLPALGTEQYLASTTDHHACAVGPLTERSSFTATTNQVLLVKARHRRLMYDRVDALRSKAHAAGRMGLGHSSDSCAYLAGGGELNPFRYNPARGRKPYYSAHAEDTGMLAVFHALRTVVCGGLGGVAESSLMSAVRLYPFASAYSIAPRLSTLQRLVGLPVASSARLPAPSRPLAVEERVVGTPIAVFEGAFVMSLVERREYISLVGGGVDGDPLACRCRVTYHLKTVTQRSLAEEAGGEGDGESDADNDEYEAVTFIGDSTAHNYALSCGTMAIPLQEVLLPLCCAGYHASLVDSEGCCVVPLPMCLRGLGRVGSSLLRQGAVPSVQDFKVVYGRLVPKGPRGAAGGAPPVPGPTRLFSPNEGLSILLVLSDNTTIISSVADVAMMGELMAYAATNTIQLPASTMAIPAFLFPAQAKISSVDVFTVPIVVPSAWSPAVSPGGGEAQGAVPSLPSSSVFSSAHVLVLTAGLSDGSVLLFDTCKESVLGCVPLQKGCLVATLRACTPANGVYSYSPSADEVLGDDASQPSSSPDVPPQRHTPVVALVTNPFAAPIINRPSLLHEAVYEAFTVPAFGHVRPPASGPAPVACPQRPLYHWYPRSCLSKVPPQIPVGCVDKKTGDGAKMRRGQRGAGIGGCGYLKMEVVFAGGMTSLGEILAKASASSLAAGGHSSHLTLQTGGDAACNVDVHVIVTVQLLDVFGFPLCGLEMGVGVPAQGAKGPNVLLVRVADTHLLTASSTTQWVPISQRSLGSVSGVSVTREFDSGLAIIALMPLRGLARVDDDPPQPEMIFTAKVGLPLGIRLFNTRRVSCVNITATAPVPSGSPFTFSHGSGSNVSVEVIDALDDNIRLFGTDVTPMPAIGGSLPIGGVVSGDVGREVARGHSGPSGFVPPKARVPQLPSLHDFPLSRSFTTAGTLMGGRQLASVAPSSGQFEIMNSLLTHCSGGNPKALLGALDAALDAVKVQSCTHQFYPTLIATVTSPSSGDGASFDSTIVTLSLKAMIHAIQASCLNWLRAHLSAASGANNPLAHQQPPGPGGLMPHSNVPIPLPTFAGLSLRSLLVVAARHNNLCEKGLSEWSRAYAGGGTGLAPRAAVGGKKIGFDERMKRIEKGLQVEAPSPTDHAPDITTGDAHRTIARMYRGPNQTVSNTACTSTKCPYTDFVLPNVVASFVVTSTSQESHTPDELVAVRLGERVDRAQLNECGGDGDDDDGYGQLAHVPTDRQRSYVFVAFTTETSTKHEFRDCIGDAEEGLYGHRALLRPESGDGDDAGGFVAFKGIARQGGPYRSHIAVFDVSLGSYEAEGAQNVAHGPLRSLTPSFVFPVPTSTVSSSHVLSGFDVCWVQGQAHCYLSSALPTARPVHGAVPIMATAPPSPPMPQPHLHGFRHSRSHHLAHIVLGDGIDDATRLLSPPSSSDGVARPPTQLMFEDSLLRAINPFKTCGFVGLAAGRKGELEMACLARVRKEVDACRANPAARSHLGRPLGLGREVLGYRVPQPPSNSSATQKEQGFFKRLTTGSYGDLVEKVEKSSLTSVAEVDFDGFFAAAQSAALRNLTPSERRSMLLQSDRASAKAGGPGRTQGALSGINETKDVMNENLQLLNERGEKIDRLRLKTREMHEEAATFADLAAQLKAKQRSRWF